MKSLLLLLALAGLARAQTPEPAVPPAAAPAVPVDPRWKVKLDETPAERIQGLLPAPEAVFGPARGADDADFKRPPVVRPPAAPQSYLGGLVTVGQKANGSADVRADITAIVLPQSPAGTLTVGDLLHAKAPPGMGAADAALQNNSNRFAPKGPSAVAAVTLKITF